MRSVSFLALLATPLLVAGNFAACTRPATTSATPAASASAQVPAPPRSPVPAEPAATTYAVRFERTPCMGKCPVYTLEIEPDGSARYHGGAFAPVEGDKQLEFPTAVVLTIAKLTEQMHFADMPEDEYGHGMMDAPSAIVTLRLESGELKTVKCTGRECPPELLALHRYLDRQTRTALGLPSADEGEE